MVTAATGKKASGGVVHLDVAGQDVKVTNPDKVLYPETGTIKQDIIDYYRAIAPALIPHVADRPVTLKRWPEGTGGQMFFQKSAGAGTPDWVKTHPLQHENSVKDYVMVDDEPTLAWLGQMGALELHVPQWQFDAAGQPAKPDRFVLDLDPGEGAGLAECAEVARLARPLLQAMGLDPMPVTSGSKGIQLYARLPGTETSAEVGEVAHELARKLQREHPDLVVSDQKKTLRRGKVLVDWSQNNGKKTTIAPYSLRGLAAPTVAAPRTWAELDDPNLRQLTYQEVLQRYQQDGDLLAALDGAEAHRLPVVSRAARRGPAATTGDPKPRGPAATTGDPKPRLASAQADEVHGRRSTKTTRRRQPKDAENRHSAIGSAAQPADQGAESRPASALVPPTPMLASMASGADQRMLRADAARTEHQWSFEMKWDGDRVLAIVEPGPAGHPVARLLSRNGIDVGAKYAASDNPKLAGYAKKIPALLDALASQVRAPLPVVLDAELVALDAKGRPDFSLLRKSAGEPQLMVFDVLRIGDRDLTAEPYHERRTQLEAALAAEPPINIPPAFDGTLDAALAASAQFRLEGVMAKRRAATYQPGARSKDWLKIKHHKMQEVVVVGWRPRHAGEPNEDVNRAGALLLAIPGADGTLRYVGKVGTGFTDAQRREVVTELADLKASEPPVSDVPRADAKDARWVRPERVGEVEFAEWTGDFAPGGKPRLRHVSWRGWRPDKQASDVRLEQSAAD